jgi:hypothetical protein
MEAMDVGQMLAAYMRGEVADHCEAAMEGIYEMDSKPTGYTGREWVRRKSGMAVKRGKDQTPKANAVA